MATKYYVIHGGTILGRVENASHAAVYRNSEGRWVEAPHLRADVSGRGGNTDADEITEQQARTRFPEAFNLSRRI